MRGIDRGRQRDFTEVLPIGRLAANDQQSIVCQCPSRCRVCQPGHFGYHKKVIAFVQDVCHRFAGIRGARFFPRVSVGSDKTRNPRLTSRGHANRSSWYGLRRRAFAGGGVRQCCGGVNQTAKALKQPTQADREIDMRVRSFVFPFVFHGARIVQMQIQQEPRMSCMTYVVFHTVARAIRDSIPYRIGNRFPIRPA